MYSKPLIFILCLILLPTISFSQFGDVTESIDKAIAKIDENSNDWEEIVKNLPNQIGDELGEVLDRELRSVVNEAIGKSTIFALCTSGVIKKSLIRDLENIELKFLIFKIKVKPNGKPSRLTKKQKREIEGHEKNLHDKTSEVCFPAPSSLKFGEPPLGNKLVFYGAYLDFQSIKLVVEKCNGRKVNISNYLSRSKYLATLLINVQNGYFIDENDKKIILQRHDGGSISEVPIEGIVRYRGFTSPSFGQDLGNEISLMPSNYQNIKQIWFKKLNMVDAFQITWDTGSGTPEIGEAAFNEAVLIDQVIKIPPHVKIVKISGKYIPAPNHSSGISDLTFHLSDGRSLSVNPNFSGLGEYFEYKVPTNSRLIGIAGKFYTWLRQVRFNLVEQTNTNCNQNE